MRTRQVFATLAAAPLAASLFIGVPAAQAASDPDLTISSITLNKTAVAVTGLNTVPVTVTVTGSYDDPKFPLVATLERTGGSGAAAHLFADLDQVSAGTWRGVVNVPSMANGTFKVVGVQPGNYAGVRESPDEPTPFDGPALAVQGTHPPKITGTKAPSVVPVGKPFSITWHVVDSTTGKAYGSKLSIGLGETEPTCGWQGRPAQTDTRGVLTVKYAAGTEFGCLNIPGTPTTVYGLSIVP